ncbi:hypothetical protein AAFF_G00118050 [Aldrovandia affinis]|uniref:Uncharacterized protein n=1 Tax=Aldrovandia affinis TaxID=143900 RepID=A0AAD7RSY5_9TELE|nr:hypothetical protein AAFF_G00118050 [Aldrovandia affinis]
MVKLGAVDLKGQVYAPLEVALFHRPPVLGYKGRGKGLEPAVGSAFCLAAPEGEGKRDLLPSSTAQAFDPPPATKQGSPF